MGTPLLAVVLIALAVALPNGITGDVYTLTRLAGLFGYQLIFLAVLSSAFVRPLSKAFGRPFVTLHHIVAISGLSLIVLHPILASSAWGDRSILLPRFESLQTYIQWGGSPALLVLIIAVLAAGLRQQLKDAWQVVHGLTYVAFVLGTAHAATAPFTTDLQSPWIRVVTWLLAAAALAVCLLRRTTLKPKRRTQR